MKAIHEPGSRTILITELPETLPNGIPTRMTELEISIRYTDRGDDCPGQKAIPLDGVIIPAIVESLNGMQGTIEQYDAEIARLHQTIRNLLNDKATP